MEPFDTINAMAEDPSLTWLQVEPTYQWLTNGGHGTWDPTTNALVLNGERYVPTREIAIAMMDFTELSFGVHVIPNNKEE